MPQCSQPKCRFGESGVCLEGHKQECPHLLPLSEILTPRPIQTPVSATDLDSQPESHIFYTGEKLTISETSQLLNSSPVVMVLCVGAQWAGKTTFLARIGEMFRNGSIKDFRFAGSRTLCAFERISWLATITSGSGRPDTARTFRAEREKFFHLRVQRTEGSASLTDILISDLPGEDFPNALQSREFCVQQRALARADHLVMFIDCSSLIDKAKRHSERDNAKLFLSQIEKSRHDPTTLQVQVLFSRWDYVTKAENRAAHEAFCKAIELDLQGRFGNTFGALRFATITARPDDFSVSDSGIQNVFSNFLQSVPRATVVHSRGSRNPARDFCAFGQL